MYFFNILCTSFTEAGGKNFVLFLIFDIFTKISYEERLLESIFGNLLENICLNNNKLFHGTFLTAFLNAVEGKRKRLKK